MNSVGKAINEILQNGTTALPAHPDFAKHDYGDTYITYRVSGITPFDTKDGPSDLDEIDVDVTIYSTNADTLLDLADKVRNDLDRVAYGSYNGVGLGGVQFQGEDSDYNDITERYECEQRYIFRVSKNITHTPPGGSCDDGTVTNSDDTFSASVASGGSLVLADNTITDVDGTTRDVAAQTDVVCEWTSFNVVNTDGDVCLTIGSYPATSPILPKITVTEVNGTTESVATCVDIVCEWTTLFVINSSETILATVLSYPSGNRISLPNITLTEVNGDDVTKDSGVDLLCSWFDIVLKDSEGTTLDTIESYPAGGEFTVTGGGGATGIVYQRPQWEGQITSFADGDVGYSAANGAYNYDETGDISARLDYSSANPFYTLINDNAFGNKYRFTTDIGTEASDGKANFVTGDFVGANQSGYIIDHLTGLGYMQGKVAFGDNWTTGMATVFAFSNYYSGWRAISIAEINTVINDNFGYYETGNIFDRGEGVSGNDTSMYLGNTDMIVSNTNAFRLLDTSDFRRVSKTFSTSIAFYVVRNHY